MKRIICIASIAAAALTEPASAADLNRGFADEYADRPVLSWAGFYIGGHVGATLEDELLFSTPGQNLIAGFAIEEALMTGVHAGYNWRTPAGWVYGLEADLSIIDDELVADLGIFELTDYLATVRGRIGFATGVGLLYSTAGAAFLAYDDEIGEQIGETAFGFVVGAGFERKFGRNFSLGVEGLYYSLAYEFNGGGDEVDTDRNFWTLRARASYHLDRDTAEALK
jgi:opacity protein-like surface antigen